jgi:hypothetical protein
LRKYVFQNATHARKVIFMIANGKKMSTYPDIKKLMLLAYEKALDNYKAFAEICDQSLEKIYYEIKKLEQERIKFTNSLSKKED